MTYKVGKMHYLDYTDHTGKRIREPWSTSKEAADTEEKKRKRAVLLLKGDAGQFGQTKWEDFKFLVEAKFYPTRKKSTIKKYQQFISWIDTYIKPHRLIDLTDVKIEDMRLKLVDEGKTPHTIERGLRAGHALMTFAKKRKLIQEKFDWSAVEPTQLPEAETISLTIEEFKLVTDTWGHDSKSPLKPELHQAPLYLFAIICRRLMLRPSEGFYAKWEDLSFNTGTDKAELKILDDEYFEHDVKKQSYRTLSVPSHLTTLLKELKKTAKSEYLIDAKNTKTNKRLTAQHFFKVVAKELDRLGLEKATAYSFRHTGATHMVVKNKQDLPTARKIVGHKTLETITKYLHPVTEDMIEATQMLEDLEYSNEHIICGTDCLRCPKKTEIIKASMIALKIDNKKDPLN